MQYGGPGSRFIDSFMRDEVGVLVAFVSLFGHENHPKLKMIRTKFQKNKKADLIPLNTKTIDRPE
mgnify:CR=1 FL=1|jgi:hypothetical protein